MARHPEARTTEPTVARQPAFAEPQPTPDPTKFEVRHPSDKTAFREIDELNREHRLHSLPFPPPRGLPEPRLNFAAVLGPNGAHEVRRIMQSGQLVFHAVGDTGNVRSPEPQNEVADKMVGDFDDSEAKQRPQFLFHLGDVIYNFGEDRYYYDQFYEPWRDYPAPILGLAGNHDGMVAPGVEVPTLAAFLRNFCATEFEVMPEAGGLVRTAQIQPGVFYTFEAPFLRILALYSGTLEDPGVIADAHIGESQLKYLEAALARVASDQFQGALIIAHHHPAYTAGSKHGWSIEMQTQIDTACRRANVWPHAVLSGHAHNYQRFTRIRGETQIPYVICGNGGHGLARLARKGSALRTPMQLQVPGHTDKVVLENYDDQHYGYLRVVVTKADLRIEFQPASDGLNARTPDDVVTVDLASRRLAYVSS